MIGRMRSVFSGRAAITAVVFVAVVSASPVSVERDIYGGWPQQVHLSYAGSASEMMVTWSTSNKTDSVVEYGEGGLAKTAKGSSVEFEDGGDEHRVQYIHRVRLTGLTPGHTYMYHCGSVEGGWSDLYVFTAMKDGTDWSPSFAAFGDMGNENAQSLSRLQGETQRGMYDFILHVGDFAYDMDSENARVGDAFMNQIQSIAAYVPYMTCVGNHENAYNFSNYVSRFSMPGGVQSLFYSFNVGPAHIIGFSTEVYFYIQYGLKQMTEQYKWLEQDLMEAAKPENRKQRPWIITMGHRPMYCSNNDHDDCTRHESVVRKGHIGYPGVEDLFYKYGVDLEIWAHEHTYERLWPVYDYKVYNGSLAAPYTNPKAPVHIITGSAGCRERHDGWIPNPPAWSALRNSDYGYTRFKLHNSTHLYLEQVSDDKDGQVIDSIWVIKDQHGPYSRT
ncbi:ACP7 [Branchiostoma lanceolatum]|uniref:Purple acid phosphatase n=1 Tax=Branchiostoma lanceolatum TaxID=7740 RepID=A0A8J9ZTA3_BRALA|nr:ACP7 [Branchiostoma lanceolatum]